MVPATAGSRGWFCLGAAGLVFLSKAEDRFCREGCPVALRQCLGMVDPALAGIHNRDHIKRMGGGKGKKKKPPKFLYKF